MIGRGLLVVAGMVSMLAGIVPLASAQPLGIRGLVSFGAVRMDASDSFDAIFGTSTLSEVGGGVQVTNVWRGVFAEVTGGRSKKRGERAFVHEGTVFPLGIRLDATITPLDIVAGYRFNRRGVLIPYVGGGYTSVAYRETSPFAESGDDVDERYGGLVALAGVEARALSWLHVRGEARYRRVPDALGRGGVSAAFGEDELGGWRFGAMVGIGR